MASFSILKAGNLIDLFGNRSGNDLMTLMLRHTDVEFKTVERKLEIPLVSADKLTTVATKLPSARKQKKTRRA